MLNARSVGVSRGNVQRRQDPSESGEIGFTIHRYSLWTVAPTNFVCVCVSVPLLRLISRLIIKGRILMKLGENV